ncbi:hypothetical protein ACFW1A_25785 [Kitasatospora sp. NPDC058965]|uniref:hypothetical protein n=1 Tax=Kitasatospora sp. NPDC058965 TaxID=3346682 RepID=UPI0036972380
MASTPHNAVHGPPRDDARDGPQSGDDNSGDPSRTPSWSADPYLQVIWSQPPDITGNFADSTGSGSGGHRHHPALAVDLGSVWETENGILGRARTSVAGYMQLKELCRSAIDGGSIWGQHAMKRVEHPPIGTRDGYQTVRPDTMEADGPVQQAANEYARAMDPTMSEVLRQIADAIESVGQFTALLNRAGQLYAHADRGSFFPDPPPPPVTT